MIAVIAKLDRRAGFMSIQGQVTILETGMNTGAPVIFERSLLRARRDRLAWRRGVANTGADVADFLFREVASQLCDRLLDFRRRFPLALELGVRDGLFAKAIGDAGGVETLLHCDLSVGMLRRARSALCVAGDEERLPFRAGAFDLAISNLALHWVNDLPGALTQIRDALKPDGLFLAAMFGAGTLGELRQSLIEAESEESGGASLRVAPFAGLRDAAGLLQRAGFALPVADQTEISVTYADIFGLLRDLQAMGETSVLADRPKRPARRSMFARAGEVYAERFSNKDGRIPATFQVIFMAGWAPHPAQQRPAKRGSGTVSLGQAIGAKDL
jgi:SAM-dependent methyltransferase